MTDGQESNPGEAPKRKRRSPQPRSFDSFIIMFSDGTHVVASQSDLLSKIEEANKIAQDEEENLTFEVRGLSKRIMTVRQKSGGASSFDLSGGNAKVDVTKSKNSGLDITFED